jgi:Holliday junction resolvase RusA-like endonuclease
MKQIKVKPIGINEQYKGKRFLTDIGKKFKSDSAFFIPLAKLELEKIKVVLEFGFSNSNQDIDGPVKSCLDILQKRLNFNDNIIYELAVKKQIVKKGEEFWSYEIIKLEN